MLIDPHHIPQVEVASMNEVHQEEVELLNEIDDLASAVEAGSAAEEVLQAKLREYRAHMREHFAGEEDLMQSVGFPAFEVHKQEHDRVLTLVERVYGEWERSGDPAPVLKFLREQVPPWVAQHITTMDTMTAQFVAFRQGEVQ